MTEPRFRADVAICGGTGCKASEQGDVAGTMMAEIARRGLADEVRVIRTGCRGFCSMGPTVVIYPDGIFYCRVAADDVAEIAEETLTKGRPVRRLLYEEPASHQRLPTYDTIPFYGKQMRIALRNCGVINPERIEEYIARGGYEALGQALTSMTPEEVIDVVKRSGLRGRGGAGFPTGLKWEFTRKAPGTLKYLICNADEGDPGAFMDRSILEGDPHSVLEGMALGAYAIGAREGYVYCRAEYPLAVQRLRIAIQQAKNLGLLGDGILGTNFSFDLHLKEGAGAFVCGEETALIGSIEGKRGEPRNRPPFPANSGLWGKPTNINNVETWANISPIFTRGPEWFASIGTDRSKGTKVFALSGKVNNVGLVEVPMGISLGDIVFDIGGGIQRGREFKAVQTGGPLGGCIPITMLNTPIDYDSLTAAGATMGSGGMIVMDEDTCMVEIAKFFLTFAAAESCGQCTPCRVGGKQLLDVLDRITRGEGREEDLDLIDDLSRVMADGSLCALGKLTPSPVRSTLLHFRDEYLAHIRDKRCPAGRCPDLVHSRCVNACPAGVDVPAYIALVGEGKYAEALSVHRERNPFAAICGRVCPAFCEQKCRRAEIDSPVGVRLIKRFMADHEITRPWTPQRRPATGKKVAVIGGGPAGLTAALRLAEWGHEVVVHEALPVAGGMMTVGIPDYRLPREILQAEIDNIVRAGVEIKLNSRLGRDFTIRDLRERDPAQDGAAPYDAVVIAIGAHMNRRMNVPGEHLRGVISPVNFLRDVALGEAPDMRGKRVAVIGGGDTAMDCARTAIRLGATETHVVYRRTREEMPALEREILEAEEEGVKFHVLVAPSQILGSVWVEGIRCQRMMLGEFDESGRRKPIPAGDSEFDLPVEVVIPAIGQLPDLTPFASELGLETSRLRTLPVDGTGMTAMTGVFAAGEIATGPDTVVAAVGQGNKVASYVDNYLRGRHPAADGKFPDYRVMDLTYDMEQYVAVARVEPPVLALPLRQGNFREVEQRLSERDARTEARRCLRCDLERVKGG
ncbi:MAG: NADH-quinone oxidoreductase subunit NuoF [Armatimonadetes bacterium]|nr:NADH-quinone oxidoreductase subunit NuoF [Armatimonadota bacterium]